MVETKKEKREQLKELKSMIDDLNYYTKDLTNKRIPEKVENAITTLYNYLDKTIKESK